MIYIHSKLLFVDYIKYIKIFTHDHKEKSRQASGKWIHLLLTEIWVWNWRFIFDHLWVITHSEYYFCIISSGASIYIYIRCTLLIWTNNIIVMNLCTFKKYKKGWRLLCSLNLHFHKLLQLLNKNYHAPHADWMRQLRTLLRPQTTTMEINKFIFKHLTKFRLLIILKE